MYENQQVPLHCIIKTHLILIPENLSVKQFSSSEACASLALAPPLLLMTTPSSSFFTSDLLLLLGQPLLPAAATDDRLRSLDECKEEVVGVTLEEELVFTCDFSSAKRRGHVLVEWITKRVLTRQLKKVCHDWIK